MWQILAILLAAGLAVAAVRHQLLKQELARMASAMGRIHTQGSRRQLTIGTQQPQLAQLATAINTLYDDMDTERAANRAALDEMRQSMANISHDLRTPLTSVLGYLQLLRGGQNSPRQQQHFLDVAYQKASSLNQLVGGVFQLARLESGGHTFQHRRLDAGALLEEELAGCYTQMAEKNLIPEVHLPNTPLWIIGDKDALSRVFQNLLANMAKHGQAPLSVVAQTQDAQAVFRFSNRAPQLKEEDLAQLFQRFFTADRMRSGKDTGLGLAIVKEFVEQMGGAITASWEGESLTFTLRWPLAAGAAAQ